MAIIKPNYKKKKQLKPKPYLFPLQNKCFLEKSCRMPNLNLIWYQNVTSAFRHLHTHKKALLFGGKNTRILYSQILSAESNTVKTL